MGPSGSGDGDPGVAGPGIPRDDAAGSGDSDVDAPGMVIDEAAGAAAAGDEALGVPAMVEQPASVTASNSASASIGRRRPDRRKCGCGGGSAGAAEPCGIETP